ncbi:anti-anti-sigma factor [Roseiarcus fermentans]|uniref:Anti-anti-sigma factor n=1 Tax=Roseiarcus fermentans TaxID=1473586 RepID=A0A366FUH9_9HYPH|nr:STAS domain-containing protein [Roseiarcus fermentans]RBP18247.1 anti-anti-sigma factor [Roseiarcus fermentans]
MLTFTVDQDMDHAGMSAVRASFDELARSPVDVCLDLSRVRFMDSAGLTGMIRLRSALSKRSLEFAVAHAQGQPLRLMRGVSLDRAAAPGVAAPGPEGVDCRRPVR